MRGPKAVEVQLSDEERMTLQAWARRPKTAQALAMRSRIVLACAEGKSNTKVAEDLSVTRPMVTKWRNRFVVMRLLGLLDDPRPGRPRLVTDQKVEAVITKTLKERPGSATRWSTRSMATAMGMSQTSISRIWRALGLQPRGKSTLQLPTDPEFVGELRDIVGVYFGSAHVAVVFCVEKSQIQDIDWTQPAVLTVPDAPASRTRDDILHDTMSVLATPGVIGNAIDQRQGRHLKDEFQRFLSLIDREVPRDLDVHLVLDNTNTYKMAEIQRWQRRHPRFYFHVVPTSASWLEVVQRWFTELNNKWMPRSTHPRVTELEAAIVAWLATWRPDPRTFIWAKSGDQILTALASYCQRISDSGTPERLTHESLIRSREAPWTSHGISSLLATLTVVMQWRRLDGQRGSSTAWHGIYPGTGHETPEAEDAGEHAGSIQEVVMPARGEFNQIHDVLNQLHEAGVINLDKSMREMLGPKEALGRLSPGGDVESAVIAWDGYGLVIKTAAMNVSELSTVAERLRGISGGPA
jgi:transposase